MAQADHLNDIYFSTSFPIDKIVYESEVLTYLELASFSTTHTLDNPYGRKCFISLTWSVDNENWYPAQAYIEIANAYTVSGWVDDDNVYILTENINFAGIDRTFYVKYILDEIE